MAASACFKAPRYKTEFHLAGCGIRQVARGVVCSLCEALICGSSFCVLACPVELDGVHRRQRERCLIDAIVHAAHRLGSLLVGKARPELAACKTLASRSIRGDSRRLRLRSMAVCVMPYEACLYCVDGNRIVWDSRAPYWGRSQRDKDSSPALSSHVELKRPVRPAGVRPLKCQSADAHPADGEGS